MAVEQISYNNFVKYNNSCIIEWVQITSLETEIAIEKTTFMLSLFFARKIKQ